MDRPAKNLVWNMINSYESTTVKSANLLSSMLNPHTNKQTQHVNSGLYDFRFPFYQDSVVFSL